MNAPSEDILRALLQVQEKHDLRPTALVSAAASVLDYLAQKVADAAEARATITPRMRNSAEDGNG